MQRLMFYASIVSGATAIWLAVEKGIPPVAVTAFSFGFALLHFATTIRFLRIVHSPFRWLILLWSAVVLLIFLVDGYLLLNAWKFRQVNRLTMRWSERRTAPRSLLR